MRDVGPVVYRLIAGAVPIKAHGWRIVEDGEARAELRKLLDTGWYHREA